MKLMELSNNLGTSKSQYLREAWSQPVHWQSYSDDVFRIAVELDRPILLDIGAVWCHWCHVMDDESYSDSEVAGLINDNFVPVKVDRDQMPDVDSRYQAAVGAMTGAGGWPLTVFLTPDGKPFYGGTYFPKKDLQGRPGLITMLPRIADTYREQKEEVRKSADHLLQQLTDYERDHSQRSPLGPEIVKTIIEDARSKMDRQFGGFGRAPKFFNATALMLLLETTPKAADADTEDFIKITLKNIACGGVYDHIGGGFHRYSVDRYWHVPHFEKMLYDNAMMMRVYLKAFGVYGDSQYLKSARETADWIVGPMRSPDGPFYAHQDADIGPNDDGTYWTWTNEEIKDALTSDEISAFVPRYDIRQEPSDIYETPGRNVLRIALPVDEIAIVTKSTAEETEKLLSSARNKLLNIRNGKKLPYIDKTIFADRNGLAISALVEASLELNEREYYRAAENAADFILEKMTDGNGRVVHAFLDSSAVYQGLLDDQVFFGTSLLDLFEVMRNDRHLAGAEKIASGLLRYFEDGENGGFFDRASDSMGEGFLSSKRKPIDDTPTPAGNPAAAIFFDRLYSITENRDYSEVSRRTLESFAGSAGNIGIYAATYGQALNLHLALRKKLR